MLSACSVIVGVGSWCFGLVLLLPFLFCGFRVLSDSGCRRGLFFVVGVLSWVGLVLCGSGSVWCCRCGVCSSSLVSLSFPFLCCRWWFGLLVVGVVCRFRFLFRGELVLCGSGSLRFFVVCVFMFGSFCR